MLVKRTPDYQKWLNGSTKIDLRQIVYIIPHDDFHIFIVILGARNQEHMYIMAVRTVAINGVVTLHNTLINGLTCKPQPGNE